MADNFWESLWQSSAPKQLPEIQVIQPSLPAAQNLNDFLALAKIRIFEPSSYAAARIQFPGLPSMANFDRAAMSVTSHFSRYVMYMSTALLSGGLVAKEIVQADVGMLWFPAMVGAVTFTFLAVDNVQHIKKTVQETMDSPKIWQNDLPILPDETYTAAAKRHLRAIIQQQGGKEYSLSARQSTDLLGLLLRGRALGEEGTASLFSEIYCHTDIDSAFLSAIADKQAAFHQAVTEIIATGGYLNQWQTAETHHVIAHKLACDIISAHCRIFDHPMPELQMMKLPAEMGGQMQSAHVPGGRAIIDMPKKIRLNQTYLDDMSLVEFLNLVTEEITHAWHVDLTEQLLRCEISPDDSRYDQIRLFLLARDFYVNSYLFSDELSREMKQKLKDLRQSPQTQEIRAQGELARKFLDSIPELAFRVYESQPTERHAKQAATDLEDALEEKFGYEGWLKPVSAWPRFS